MYISLELVLTKPEFGISAVGAAHSVVIALAGTPTEPNSRAQIHPRDEAQHCDTKQSAKAHERISSGCGHLLVAAGGGGRRRAGSGGCQAAQTGVNNAIIETGNHFSCHRSINARVREPWTNKQLQKQKRQPCICTGTAQDR